MTQLSVERICATAEITGLLRSYQNLLNQKNLWDGIKSVWGPLVYVLVVTLAELSSKTAGVSKNVSSLKLTYWLMSDHLEKRANITLTLHRQPSDRWFFAHCSHSQFCEFWELSQVDPAGKLLHLPLVDPEELEMVTIFQFIRVLVPRPTETLPWAMMVRGFGSGCQTASGLQRLLMFLNGGSRLTFIAFDWLILYSFTSIFSFKAFCLWVFNFYFLSYDANLYKHLPISICHCF